MNLKKLERYLRVNLLGRGPRLIKRNLPGRGLTKVEKYCPTPIFPKHFAGGTLLASQNKHGSSYSCSLKSRVSR